MERDEDGIWFHVPYENIFPIGLALILIVILLPMVYLERAKIAVHRTIDSSVYHVEEIQCAKKCGDEFGIRVSSLLDCRGCRCQKER